MMTPEEGARQVTAVRRNAGAYGAAVVFIMAIVALLGGTLPAAGREGPPRRSWAGTVPAPDFPEGMEWLHVERPLTWEDVRGKAVVLDFWTYGCINCLHNLPDLLRLQEKYADELVIIGIHSAKFPHEGETPHIRDVSRRYGLDYPMVNDREFVLFRTWGARAWPTLMLIDPDGKVVGRHEGEGAYDVLNPVLTELIAEFDALGKVDRGPLKVAVGRDQGPRTELFFPGKVIADPDTSLVWIADTHHHRIVAADGNTGEIVRIIGEGQPGFRDGDPSMARFIRPQGLALAREEGALFVADSGNHALRRVDLEDGTVSTVTGTGRQAWTYVPVAGIAPEVELNSPWDVLYDDGTLYVAMAGAHQLWTVHLPTGRVEHLAGSGREGTEDGPPALAELAQPMGLALDRERRRLYFADTEASSVRWVDLSPEEYGTVHTLAGSGLSLFHFGDEDGVGTAARFQHPRGVAVHEGYVYVADTYNGKIKRIDPDTRDVTTAWGGDHGWRDGPDPLFYEPGGISEAGGRLYVADTNNHAIRIIDVDRGEVTTLVVWDGVRAAAPEPDSVLRIEPVVFASGTARLSLDVVFPPGFGLNELAPSRVAWRLEGDVAQNGASAGGTVTDPAFPLVLDIPVGTGDGRLAVDLHLLYCRTEQQGLCYIEEARLEAAVSGAPEGEAQAEWRYTVALPE